MTGRVTREHDTRQGFDGVLWEGGSAITDADLNAAFDAEASLRTRTNRVFITPAGTADDGWRATRLTSFLSGGRTLVDFNLDPGHYMMDGNLLTNPEQYAFADQPFALSSDMETDIELEWPSVADIEALPDNQRFDAVVLDSQYLLVNVTEDSELDEVAMRSDPATRTHFSHKVRVFEDTAPDCATARVEVLNALAGPNASITLPSPRISSDGLLRVGLGTPERRDNPCAPDLALGYFGRQNHTIKVKLTAADRFVWAYRNGGTLYRATLDDDLTLRMVTPFPDASHFPTSGQIVELCTWDVRLANDEKTAVPLGRFHAIDDGYDPGTETLTLQIGIDGDLRDWYDSRAAQGDEPFLFLRFWEAPAIDDDTATDTGLNVPLAETGILLDFLNDGVPGDSWTFSVRANANDTVFPKRFLEPQGQPPGNVERFADLIALIHWTVDGGNVVGHIHDCRRRVRPLWQLKGCCTLTVGDGHSSFGDFNRLADALDALPHEGGRICLLPGTHQGNYVIKDRENVTIEGCRGQTRVRGTDADAPVFLIEDCTRIRLRDFTIEDDQVLAIAGARNRRMALERITTNGRGSAVSLPRSTRLNINNCTFFAEAEPSIIPADQFPGLRPLVFIGGDILSVKDCVIRCEDQGLTLQSLGGLQIASDSEHVRIEGNLITGGLGHGITLGHLQFISIEGITFAEFAGLSGGMNSLKGMVETNAEWQGNTRRAAFTGDQWMASDPSVMETIPGAGDLLAGVDFGLDENPFEISLVAVQGCLGIDPTPTQPDPEDDDDDWGQYFIAGEVSHVHIQDNEILHMGGSGISIPSWNLSLRPTLGENLVTHLAIERNHIADCSRVAIATTMEDAELQEIGFGGIALEVVRFGKIGNNTIHDMGRDVRSPCVGIYLAEATACHIHDNLLENIGRTERGANRNILGVSGGIIVDNAEPKTAEPVIDSAGGSLADMRMRNFRIGSSLMGVEKVGATHRDMDEFLRANIGTLRLPRGESLRIQNNQVTVNFGMSLDVRGAGSFHIADNHFTSLAARFNPQRPRLAVNLSVVNTEVPEFEFLVFLLAIIILFYLLYQFSAAAPGEAGHDAINKKIAEFLKYILTYISRFTANRDFGVIQFQNNHVRYENFVTSDNAAALNVILTPFDLQMTDNAMKSLHRDWSAFFNTLAVGFYSTQCMTNRLDTRVDGAINLALLSIGLGNSTYLNHASHPILPIRMQTAQLTGSGNLTS